jgi:hypothetical protein
MYTEQLTQQLGILGHLPPQSLAVGTDNSITNIDMSKFKRVLWILDVGAFGASGTVDFKIQESKTSGGAYQDISGTAITQLQAGGGNNRLVTVEFRQDQLDPGYQFIRHNLVIGTAASQVCVICLAGEAIHKPEGGSVGGQDIAAVAQRLVL